MADIPVNANQWNEVSESERASIVQGLRESGILKPDDNVVPSVGLDALEWDPGKDICKAVCDATAGAAVAWCIANTAGVATAACIALANSAREECKRRC